MKERRVIFVGILEENEKAKTFKIVNSVLHKYGYENLYENKMGNFTCLAKEESFIVLFDMKLKDMIYYETLGIEIDILIHSFLGVNSIGTNMVENKLSNCKYYLINSDDENWTQLALKDLNGIIISYGFNSKATLTVSSYNLDHGIRASIYLQREIVDLCKNTIEPFEFSIESKIKGKNNIYSLMAVSILTLLLGYKKTSIKL